MRTMYDSTGAARIPAGVAMVAGYIDGNYKWSEADWALFPKAVKVRIAVLPSTLDGHVLDVEHGDAAPDHAPVWVSRRRQAGADPSVYCNLSTWPAVAQAFRLSGIAAPHYWIARWGHSEIIPPGAIALQYRAVGPYDLSIVANYWPGVDQVEAGAAGSRKVLTAAGISQAVAAIGDIESAASTLKKIMGILSD